jgi:hypothetical protein
MLPQITTSFFGGEYAIYKGWTLVYLKIQRSSQMGLYIGPKYSYI